jgi:hypothetical protein
MRQKHVIGLTYQQLVDYALTLPAVEQSTSYGTPALKVRGKLMVRLWEDTTTVVLKTNWDERERLLTFYPETFYLTDHYRDYSWVLMRLAAGNKELMQASIDGAWREVAPKSLLSEKTKK